MTSRGIASLDRDAPEPLWSQLTAVIRQQISDGRYVADQALPSESELSEIYGVSRTVVREALGELVRSRQIYKIKGKGAFVSPSRVDLRFVGTITGSAADLLATGQRVATKILEQELGAATPDEAMALGIENDAPVVRLRRLRVVAGTPWLLVRTTLPAALVPGLESAKLENVSLYEVLRRRYGLIPAGADRWLEATIPTAKEHKLLETRSGTPILSIESVTWAEDGTRFEWYQALHRSDQARFYVGIRNQD